MIDLRYKGLPDAIEVDGESFFIKTDFRLWLQFGEMFFKSVTDLRDYSFLLQDPLHSPKRDYTPELLLFYLNPNATPRDLGQTDNTKIIDYIQDGEYIYSSFMAEYGIDLVDIEDLHWHKFKALLEGLSDGSRLKKIMSYRSYTKSSKSLESQYKELREMWSLPTETDRQIEDNKQEIMSEINSEFYNC